MRLLALLLVVLLSACANVSQEKRRTHAETLAATRGWQPFSLPTQDFVLMAHGPVRTAASKTLAIYIEGDGLAWLSPSQASDDPTPRAPIALELALQHVQGPAVYLARPCQYVAGADQRGCTAVYWTDQRFALSVISASNQAVDTLKQRYGAQEIVLVGYSGGGAVAALVAARRTDVVRLVTVAGNLDHLAWTHLHSVPPLTGSLNPADAWAALQNIPQLHFVGAQDMNITTEVVSSYVARFPQAHRPAMQVVPGFDHACCWVQQWPTLAMQAFP
jgi:pimeloyl-ACP methyl ester carboxylesterase